MALERSNKSGSFESRYCNWAHFRIKTNKTFRFSEGEWVFSGKGDTEL